jgi:hypothetical protein
MARFLIEVPHEEDPIACARAIKILFDSGSHFFTHADFGCRDHVHKAWITVDLDSREEARAIVPPAYRAQATIVELCNFDPGHIAALLARHDAKPRQPSS